MNSHNERKTCRLCLLRWDDYEIIGTGTRQILDAIFPKLSLDVSDEPVICNKCALNLKKSFHFKSMAHTQVCLVPLIKQENGATFDLEQTSMNENQNGVTHDSRIMCSMCMNLTETGFFIPLNSLEEEGIFQRIMLEECLSDLNLSTTKNPVICTSCNKSLKSHYDFVTKCSNVERHIKLYCESEGITGGKINLNNVRKFMYRGMYCAEDNFIDKEGHCIDQGNHSEDIKMEMEDKSIIEIHEVDISDTEEKFEINAGQHDSSQIRMIFPQIEVDVKVSTNGAISMLKSEESYSKRPKINRNPEESSSGITRHTSDKYLDKDEDNALTQKCKANQNDTSETIIYKCQTCIYKTSCEDSLAQHMLTHTEKIVIYRCESCPFQTKHKVSLKRHKLMHKEASKNIMYPCSNCSYKTKYKRSIKIHMNRCTKHLPQTISNKVSSENRHMISLRTKLYQCTSCSFQARYEANVEKHMLIHKSKNVKTGKRFRCDSCPFQTNFKYSLKVHMLFHSNSADEMHECEFCQYQTVYKGNLNVHVARIHNKKLIVKNKSSTNPKENRNGDNTSMRRVHSERSIYQCKTCSYQAKDQRCLKIHMRKSKHLQGYNSLSKHGKEELKMFPCQYCKYESSYEFNTQRHEKIHFKMNK